MQQPTRRSSPQLREKSSYLNPDCNHQQTVTDLTEGSSREIYLTKLTINQICDLTFLVLFNLAYFQLQKDQTNLAIVQLSHS